MSTADAKSTIDEKVDSTHKKVIQYGYKWTIKNFSSIIDKSGEVLMSPLFSAKASDGLKWRIVAYPKGYGAATNRFTICHVRLEACKYPSIVAKYKLYFIDANGDKKYEPAQSSVFTHDKRYPCGGPPLMTARDSLIDVGVLRDNVLRIACDITTTSTAFDIPDCQLIDDLARLFEVKQCCDVNIAVCGRDFSAHKAILAARSSVFSAMFDHDMREQKENYVEITDMDDEVFEEMLRYVYTGSVRNLEKMADQLLIAAEKYALERLKVLCEEALHSGLETNNAAEVLVLADLYNAEQLKIRTIKFINRHMKDVIKTVGFNTMVNSHPHLIMETLGALYMDKDEESDE